MPDTAPARLDDRDGPVRQVGYVPGRVRSGSTVSVKPVNGSNQTAPYSLVSTTSVILSAPFIRRSAARRSATVQPAGRLTRTAGPAGATDEDVTRGASFTWPVLATDAAGSATRTGVLTWPSARRDGTRRRGRPGAGVMTMGTTELRS